MFCDSKQTCKVNYAQDHGVCLNHLITKSTISTCVHCMSTHPVLEFKFCLVCQKQNRDFSDSCCHIVCQDCKSVNFYCPECFNCEVCLSSSNLLKKAECGHVLCDECLKSMCQVCLGFIGQTESFELSLERSVFSDSMNSCSPKGQFGSLVKSESFFTQESKEEEGEQEEQEEEKEVGEEKKGSEAKVLVVDVEDIEKAEKTEDLQMKTKKETKPKQKKTKKPGHFGSVIMVLGLLTVLLPVKLAVKTVQTTLKLLR